MPEDRITILEHNYIRMHETQEQILREVQDIKNKMITEDGMNLANERMCKDIFKASDEKYASRRQVNILEKIVFTVAGAVGIFFITKLLELIG